MTRIPLYAGQQLVKEESDFFHLLAGPSDFPACRWDEGDNPLWVSPCRGAFPHVGLLPACVLHSMWYGCTGQLPATKKLEMHWRLLSEVRRPYLLMKSLLIRSLMNIHMSSEWWLRPLLQRPEAVPGNWKPLTMQFTELQLQPLGWPCNAFMDHVFDKICQSKNVTAIEINYIPSTPCSPSLHGCWYWTGYEQVRDLRKWSCFRDTFRL